MAFFRTKSPEEKAAALAQQMIRSRYTRARGALQDAILDAVNNGGADPQWVESVMPSMTRETAEAWLEIHPDPSEQDLSDLWEKDLRVFWNHAYWDKFSAETIDLAQEIGVAIQLEVARQHGAKAPDELLNAVPSWSNADREDNGAESPSPLPRDGIQNHSPPAVGVARAIEVWRWANAEKLSGPARARLDRVARLVSDNEIGSENVAAVDPSAQVNFDQTLADIKHSREMIQHVARWIADDPDSFEVSMGLYLDGGGESDGLDIAIPH